MKFCCKNGWLKKYFLYSNTEVPIENFLKKKKSRSHSALIFRKPWLRLHWGTEFDLFLISGTSIHNSNNLSHAKSIWIWHQKCSLWHSFFVKGLRCAQKRHFGSFSDSFLDDSPIGNILEVTVSEPINFSCTFWIWPLVSDTLFSWLKWPLSTK